MEVVANWVGCNAEYCMSKTLETPSLGGRAKSLDLRTPRGSWEEEEGQRRSVSPLSFTDILNDGGVCQKPPKAKEGRLPRHLSCLL